MNCNVCDKEVQIRFIDSTKGNGTGYLGTSKPNGEEHLFRKSEFDFGFDYYANENLKKISCNSCGYVEYKSIEDNK